ncbi:hypothetical protein ACVST5_10995 [Yersinia enterocolitica]|uniref:hypothetical protein n=1 Tax=Yersinia enterocolitica TaxID=630 RepID=UPI0021558AF3|nr:hypothetical protein [Yersinia enterocolitica]
MVATSLLGYPFLTQAEQQTADGDDLFHQYHPITVNGIGKYSEAEIAAMIVLLALIFVLGRKRRKTKK